MSDAYDPTIQDLVKQIKERMLTVNTLLKFKGEPPMYPDPDATIPGGGLKIISDQWYTSALAPAAREYLTQRRDAGLGPASLDEIYAALVKGGFKFEAKDEASAKPALKQSLTKNTLIFHRLPNGLYGLSSWYPNRRNDDDEPQPRRKRRVKIVKVIQAKTRVRAMPAVGAVEQDEEETLIDAVQSAIEAMTGEFTRADVFKWLEKHKPHLATEKRKASAMSMFTRLRGQMGLEATSEVKGSPSTYRKAEPANGRHN